MTDYAQKSPQTQLEDRIGQALNSFFALNDSFVESEYQMPENCEQCEDCGVMIYSDPHLLHRYRLTKDVAMYGQADLVMEFILAR